MNSKIQVFFCNQNFDYKTLFNILQGQSPSGRKFVIVDANIDNPVKIFSEAVFQLGCNQPSTLLIANQAITYGAIEPEKALYEKFLENKKDGVCIVVSKEPKKSFDFFKEKDSLLEMQIFDKVLETV